MVLSLQNNTEYKDRRLMDCNTDVSKAGNSIFYDIVVKFD